MTFLKRDLWRLRSRALTRRQALAFRPLRVMLLAMRGFGEDGCKLRASALTYYTLLSTVPMLAMAFGIAKGFGIQTHLEAMLRERLQNQQEVLQWLLQFTDAFLTNTKGGVIAGIGVALLFWTIIKVLGNIERSFNDIWGVKSGRPMVRKMTDYLSIMLICPVLLTLAGSVTVFLASQVTGLMAQLEWLGPVRNLVLPLLAVLPYSVLWLLLTFLYIFMPNTKVSWRAGLTGGIVAGTIYQLVQWGYVYFQVGMSKYNAVYGGFAALPLFLVWLQLSWLIVLFGAELSFAVDNEETYEFEPDCARASVRFKRLVGLRAAVLCVKQFERGAGPASARALARELEAPIRLIRDVLYELVQAGVLTEVQRNGPAGETYQPARATDKLTVKAVLDALETRGEDHPDMVDARALAGLRKTLETFDKQLVESPHNALLRDL